MKQWPNWEKEEELFKKGKLIKLQPDDFILFGGGVVSEEEATKRQQEWENRLQKSLTMPSVGAPLDEEEWGTCKSFNSTLSREELLERNTYTGE